VAAYRAYARRSWWREADEHGATTEIIPYTLLKLSNKMIITAD
jgi:hypothetical protein